MTDCKKEQMEFQALGGKKVVTDFSGGYLSSDGGSLLLREESRRSQLCKDLSHCFTDRRDQDLVDHSLEELLKQRLFGLALGYEDLNDHDRLRCDPLIAVACDKKDPLGNDRREEDRGKALAAHSTLNRLELTCVKENSRYHKIQPDFEKIEDCLVEKGVKSIPSCSKEVVLDFDATDDPLHGAQEGRHFHGYYGHYCYLPLYCFCGNIPLWAQLRDCKRDASDGTEQALEKIVKALRKRFGKKLRIIVRGDSGFCRDTLMSWCEQHNIYYCFGLARNSRLETEIEPLMQEVKERFEHSESKEACRDFKEFEYSTLKTWSCKRRVIAKAEVLPRGENPRFIVTNISDKGFDGDDKDRFQAQRCYEEFYCARGDMENRIKEQQMDLFADRTSTGNMKSNQLRLWFSTFAYLLIERLRAGVLKHTRYARATSGSIRLRLFKIAAMVQISARRIHVRLASACPDQDVFRSVASKLCSS